MLRRAIRGVTRPFKGSETYWRDRYETGRNSGAGSYGKFAEFKAQVLNDFVRRNEIESVLEFGCGDGNQLKFAAYPRYLGIDVSEVCVSRCKAMFPQYTFKLLREYAGEQAELALSLDVIFHLVEDDVFEAHMKKLFAAATRFVIVYSSNHDAIDVPHVRHRKFSDWVERAAPQWRLKDHIPNRFPYNGDYKETSFSDFYVYHAT